MNNTELRGLTEKELCDRISTETMAYDKMVLNHKVNPLDRPSDLTKKRKELARMKTILKEKQSLKNNNGAEQQ